MLLRVAGCALCVLAVSACGGAKNAAPKSTLPPGCTVPEVEQVVTDFLTHPSFAPAARFDVYATSESDGRKFVARTPAKALAHLRRRAQIGERSRLISLRVAEQDFNNAGITFQLTRYSPDFLRRGIHQRLLKGAGTVDCAHQKVAAWVTKGP
jgi:hypothetical protein